MSLEVQYTCLNSRVKVLGSRHQGKEIYLSYIIEQYSIS